MTRSIPAIVLALFLQGCATIATEEPAMRDIRQLSVWYATDRAQQTTASDGIDYGSRRGGRINYGVATINVWPIEYQQEDAGGGVRDLVSQPIATAFAAAKPLSRESFLRSLRDSAGAGDSEQVMLFVHGFKRNFREAAEHAAQMGEGIRFGGRVVLWSWPSVDKPAAYLTDRTTLLWSQKHLAGFISELVEQGGVRRLVLIAHSLGSQALTQALFEHIGADRLAEWRVVERLVLLAPDIDLGIFRRDIVPAINQVGIPTTVYASSADLALMTSSKLNGYPRAGDSSDRVFTFPGIDTIDATQVTQSFLGHSYYRRSFAVVDDLHRMIVKNQPADQRPDLVRQRKKGGFYWKLE